MDFFSFKYVFPISVVRYPQLMFLLQVEEKLPWSLTDQWQGEQERVSWRMSGGAARYV